MEVKITKLSKEMNVYDRIQFKDTSKAVKIKDVVKSTDDTLDITVAVWGVLNVYANGKEFEVLVLQAKDGTKYTTSSPAFRHTFENFANEIESGDTFNIRVSMAVSTKDPTKTYFTCELK